MENNPKLKHSYGVFADKYTSWTINNLDIDIQSTEELLLNLPTNSINETIINLESDEEQ